MLRRNGELLRHEVPGYPTRFTDSEIASYKAAFATIEKDYQQIEGVKKQLDKLGKVQWERPILKPSTALPPRTVLSGKRTPRY